MKSWIFLVLIVVCSCHSSIKNEKASKEYNLLKERIELGLDQDQEIREAFNEKMEKTGYVDLVLNQKMGEIDSLNQIYALKYLNNYGYPSLSRDGEKLCDGIFYILQHSNQEVMKKYISGLKEMAFKGEASKTHYAMMKDRILMNDGKKQIYETQLSPRKDENGTNTANYYIWPIENNEIVDELRQEMGFAKSISKYASDLGAEYNTDEVLPVDDTLLKNSIHNK